MAAPRRTLLGVTPHPHANDQLRCLSCGLVIDWFHGWSFTAGRDARPGFAADPPCTIEAHPVTGHHRWTLEPKP